MKKLFVPVVIWGVALGMLLGATNALKHQGAGEVLVQALSTFPKPALQVEPLTLEEYQSIQKKIMTMGSIDLLPTEAGLHVRAKSLGEYAAWRLILNQVLFDTPKVIWEIEYLCSGGCPAGEAHRALLKGKKVL